MQIDHILWGVPELEQGRRDLAKQVGVEPSIGGRHPGFGTHNALLGLGEDCYLEILARDPSQTELRGFAELLVELETPRLLTWAARTDDMDALVTDARGGGLEPGEIFALSRRRPDGKLMSCRLVAIEGHDFGALVPFFIQFDEGVPHPALAATPGGRLTRLTLTSPRAEDLADALRVLHLENAAEVRSGDSPGMLAELETPAGPILLEG